MLVHGAALDSHVGPQRRQRLSGRRAVDDDQLRRSLRAGRDRRAARAGARLSAHALDREQHLLAVGAHAEATSNEIEVAFCRAGHARQAVEDQRTSAVGGERAQASRRPSSAPDAADHVLPTASTRVTRGAAAGVVPQ